MLYLYEIVNSVNGKKYIGASGNPEKRFASHKSKTSTCTKLRKAMEEFGKESFTMKVLCAGNVDYILDLEEATIKLYDTVEDGYNTYIRERRTGFTVTEETKKILSLSLKKYYETNEPHNKGDYMNTPEDNVPHYVSGFWFPTAGVASKALRMKPETIKKRRALGTLGNTEHPRVDSLTLIPVYVGGFWFPDVNIAAKALNKHRATLHRYIKNGHQEQGVPRKDITGKNNPMSGRTGGSNPNARAVSVLGEEFPSLADAVRATRFTKSMLGKRLKKGVEGFHYLDNKHLQGE